MEEARGQPERGDAVTTDGIADVLKGRMRIRHHHQPPAIQQRAPDLEGRQVKGEGRELEHHLVKAVMRIVGASDETHHSAMLDRDTLTEIATRDRLAPFYTPALLVSDERLLVQVVRDSGGQIFSMNLDGSDAREFTRLGEGLPYGLSLSPDGRRVAYHLASPQGYQIWTSNIDGLERVRVAAHPDHLYFGPSWSPDGQWLLFQDCQFKADPGHDWSDLCIARPDGTDFRVLTEGQAMWFGATYGNPRNRGGGSNIPAWTRAGEILFPRRLPGSKVPWEFQPQRPDTDHFNRDFKPELTRGGVEICRLNPRTGEVKALTRSEPPVWDFRASESSDGRSIVFCRAETGGVPALWVADADGRNERLLTRGFEEQGADHPRWLPLAGRRAAAN